jgi:hypothetical protein
LEVSRVSKETNANDTLVRFDSAFLLPSARAMDEGRERDHTSRKGGPPTLPGLYRSTIQPSRRGFYRIHVCEGEITGDNIYRCQSVCPVVLKDFEFLKKI